MKKLYKFHADCGRVGSVGSVFIADSAEVDAAIGRPVHFGEVLGKHSDIRGTLEDSNLTIVTEDPNVISVIESLGILPTGHNPLHYLEGDEE